MSKKKTVEWVLTIFLGILLCVYLIPIVMVFINSFKPYNEIMASFVALPKDFTFSNYVKAWEALEFVSASINSIAMTGITIVLLLFITMPASYQLSRNKSNLSKFLFDFFTIPYLIPFFAVMIPVLKMANNLNLNNTIWGVSVVNVGISGSFAIIMFTGFVKTIPKELDEAAFVDGCNSIQGFLKIIVPLLKPVTSSVTIIYTLWTWNNFMLPFLMLSDRDKQTLIIRVYNLLGMYGTDWEIVITALIMISAPIVFLYLIFQKSIIGGLTAGAVKG
ncbi:MAG: carbohydrate ABC transporter permease [Eubacteriales bacterium]